MNETKQPTPAIGQRPKDETWIFYYEDHSYTFKIQAKDHEEAYES